MKFKIGQLVRHKTYSSQMGQEMIIVEAVKELGKNYYFCRWMADSKIYEDRFLEIELIV